MKKCNLESLSSVNVGRAILMAANLFRRRLDHQIIKLTDDDNITGSNSHIIGFLVANKDEEIFQKNIETHFSLKPSTVSANLRLLEQKGYIIREYSKIDTRKKFVSPTEKAINFNKIICDKGLEIENEFKKVLTFEEQEQLVSLLIKLISSMEKEEN